MAHVFQFLCAIRNIKILFIEVILLRNIFCYGVMSNMNGDSENVQSKQCTNCVERNC